MHDMDGLFRVPDGIVTRWASGENPDGAPGAAAQANAGRKGAANRPLAAGDSFVMAHAQGCGVVRRIWITISDWIPEMTRGLVVRIWWDGAERPAVEAPIADLFCQALGRCVPFENMWFSSPEGRSFTMRLPMPFRTGFRMEIANESTHSLGAIYYDINYTLGDCIPDDACYLHAHWRRENPTVLRRDFEILPRVTGRGRFLGCCLSVISDTDTYGRAWWGEGEVKVYLDGDTDWPTLAGTGTEDYIATGWGQGHYAQLWHGCHVADHEAQRYGFYRLHGPDPIWFHQDCRVTIQQIGGYMRDELLEYLKSAPQGLLPIGDSQQPMTYASVLSGDIPAALFERTDDVSACAWFLLDNPNGVLPAIAPIAERTAGL